MVPSEVVVRSLCQRPLQTQHIVPGLSLDDHARLTAGEPAALCAHFAKFDRGFFDPAGSKWLCTYKIALWLWPDCPSHKNNVLRYWLKLKLAMDDLGLQQHRALRDALAIADGQLIPQRQ